MRRQVVWSKDARSDYLEILRYIAEDNPDAADRVADRFDQAAAALSDFATGRVGRVTGTYEKVLPGLPYILAYEIIGTDQGVEIVGILRIIHGARDWPAGSWPRVDTE